MEDSIDIYQEFTTHSNYTVEMSQTGIEADVTVSTIHNQNNLGAEEFQEVAYQFSEDISDHLEAFCQERAPFGETNVYPIFGRYEEESAMSAFMPFNDQDDDVEFPGVKAKEEGEQILMELDGYLSEL